MSWRIVTITKRAKVDFKMNQMIIRSLESETRIFIKEIAVVVFESTALSLTAYLLHELVKNKVKVIFCDDKRNPEAELSAYYTSFNSTAKIRQQINWNKDFMGQLWCEIVRHKIANQSLTLKKIGSEKCKLLQTHIAEVQLCDATNREAHAAKVYFHALFGPQFQRSDNENNINAALDYGYALMLSAISREIEIAGYLTQLGIFHDNTYNHLNLSSDLIEILRPLIDYRVYGLDTSELDTLKKHELIKLLDYTVNVNGQNMRMLSAIRIYCNSVLKALNENNLDSVKWISYEL